MPGRQGLLARIHILKKELAFSDADYRALLQKGFCVSSSAQLDDDDLSQLAATLEGMKSDRQELSGKNQKKISKRIWAAWYELRQYLPECKRTADYLCGIAKRNAPEVAVNNGLLDFDPIPRAQAANILRSLINAVNCEKAKLADVPF